MTRAKAKTKIPASAHRAKPAKAVHTTPPRTKAEAVIGLLKAKQGATITELMQATGWQAHSVRGFLAGSLKRRHSLEATSEKLDNSPRRYRLR